MINPEFTTHKRIDARETGLYDYVCYGPYVKSLGESRFMVAKQWPVGLGYAMRSLGRAVHNFSASSLCASAHFHLFSCEQY